MLDSSSTAPRVAIVVTGEPIDSVRAARGGFANLMREALGASVAELVTLDARPGRLPSLCEFDGVIVTGSAASVTERAPWIVDTERRLAECVAAGVYVLGVCFGHQLLAQALGGDVQRNPNGREIGSVALSLCADDALLGAAGTQLCVNMTHVDSVLKLPPRARVLGSTVLDPYAALRFGERVWGVQFHPEIDAAAMAAYVKARRAALDGEGLDAAKILGEVEETPASRGVLARFVAEVAGGPRRR
ncbi:MAG: glutamine amidotransferase [Polyangiaceae bacterium]